jgi:hypothetical protein
MGLDMYLSAKKYTYVSEYENAPDYPKVERGEIEKALCAMPIPDAFDTYGIRAFECTAMYWRKANQIHKWFVDNVQSGEDDCSPYYVSKDHLQALLKDVRTVLEDRTKAEEILPACHGCFFGGSDYDEWYFDDLVYTEKGLTKILAMPDFDSWSFEYQSSW